MDGLHVSRNILIVNVNEFDVTSGCSLATKLTIAVNGKIAGNDCLKAAGVRVQPHITYIAEY